MFPLAITMMSRVKITLKFQLSCAHQVTIALLDQFQNLQIPVLLEHTKLHQVIPHVIHVLQVIIVLVPRSILFLVRVVIGVQRAFSNQQLVLSDTLAQTQS